MVSTDLESRKRRALSLVERYPASCEILEFYAGLIGFDSDWPTLRARLQEIAPVPMREASAGLAEPEGIFLKILLRNHPPAADSFLEKNQCPECGSAPQCGVLREEGQGHALLLVCSLCSNEWVFPRSECPGCLMADEKRLGFYKAEQFPHVQTLLCENCQMYLHIIHCGIDLQAIPEVDELACTPLDVWAVGQGYKKVVANLAGI